MLEAPSLVIGRVVVSQKVYRGVFRESSSRRVAPVRFRRSWSIGRTSIVRTVACFPGALRLSRGRWGRSSRRQMALNHSWARNKARGINQHLGVPQLQLRRNQSLNSCFGKARPGAGCESDNGRILVAVRFSCFPLRLGRGPPAPGGDLPVVFAANVQHTEWVT